MLNGSVSSISLTISFVRGIFSLLYIVQRRQQTSVFEGTDDTGIWLEPTVESRCVDVKMYT